MVVTGTPAGNVGFTTCYDLRFPAVFQELRSAGAELILVPSAFMVGTGKAHWETLLRARAIENQCYVAAAAQCGACPHRCSFRPNSGIPLPTHGPRCDAVPSQRFHARVC